MSSPTPGSDPNYPQGGAPQGYGGAPQNPGGYQPAPQYSGAPAGYGAPGGQRPGTVTGAAIVAIVWGGLGALFGLIALGIAFALSALLGLVLLLSVALSVVLLVAGIFVLQGKNPKLLVIICWVAIGINLLSLIINLVQDGGNAFSGVLGFIIPGVVLALMLQPQSKQYFAARGQAY